MVSLLDIAALPATVNIRGVEITVRGISAKGVAHLLAKFPEIRLLVTGQSVDMTPERLLEAVPDAVAAIIAAGAGDPDDPANAAFESAAAGLAVVEQLDLLAKILELTLPGGVNPFIKRLAAAMKGLGVADESLKVPGMNSPNL